MNCSHETLRELCGGVCPVCPTGATMGATEPVGGDARGGSYESARPPPAPEIHSGAGHGPAQKHPDRDKTQALTKLTRDEAKRLLTRLQARRMKNSFADFVKGAWHVLEGQNPLEWNFHHDAFCQHFQIMIEEWYLAGLEDPTETLAAWRRAGRPYVDQYEAHWKANGSGRYTQRITDLAVNVGPISLKSRIFMVFGPAWVWTWCPTWEVFCSSGTPSNVDRDSMACRDLVTNAWYRETFAIEWTIRDDLDRVGKWATTVGGTREARGTGANVVGIHADAILLDDPDDSVKVWSDSARRDTWLFWQALGNRLKDLKRPVRIIIQQNLHEEDLSTRCVRAGMPRLAIPIEHDPTRRAELYTAPFGWEDPRTFPGELIHAFRFPPGIIAAERVRLGTHGFEAQYNCNPRPLEGGMIKRGWWRFFRIEDDPLWDEASALERPTGCVSRALSPPLLLKRKILPGWKKGGLDLDWLTITVDATFGSLKDTASAVGLLCVGGKAMRRYVLDDRTEPMTFHATVAAIKAMLGYYPATRCLIELKANGASVIEELKKQLEEGKVPGPDGKPVMIVVEEVNPEGGKESRAAAMVPSIEANTWYLLDGAPWLVKFIDELCVFPNAKRDDRVDAMSQLATYYRDETTVSRWGPWLRARN